MAELPSKDDFLAKLESEPCPVCWEALVHPIRTECNHYFCIACAKLCFEDTHRCPTCRKELYQEPEPEDPYEPEIPYDEVYAQTPAMWDTDVPRPPYITLLEFDDDAARPDRWSELELPDKDDLDLDTDCETFRQTLRYFFDAITVEDVPGSYREFWSTQPEWDAPVAIKCETLFAQLNAIVIEMLPPRYHEEVKGTVPKEMMCWDEWFEAAACIKNTLERLSIQQPGRSAETVKQQMMDDWSLHLQANGHSVAEYDLSLPEYVPDATFEENVQTAMNRIIIFAQEEYRRNLPENQLTQAMAEARITTASATPPADVATIIAASTESSSSSTSSHPIPEDVIISITKEVEKSVIAKDADEYRAISQALYQKDKTCETGEALYKRLWPGPYSLELAERIHEVIKAAEEEIGGEGDEVEGNDS